MKTKKNICVIVIGLLGLSLLTLGIISFIYVPMMIKSYVFDALMDLMHEDSEQYANFVSSIIVKRVKNHSTDKLNNTLISYVDRYTIGHLRFKLPD